MAADQDYIKARHKLIPVAMKIVSAEFGVQLSDGNNSANSGEVGKSFVYASCPGKGKEIGAAFLATMDQLYAESQEETAHGIN